MREREHHDHYYGHDAARIFESPLFRRVHERAARQFLRVTGIRRTDRILSLGCGDGALELRLAPFAAEIVGIDVSPVAIERARARAQTAACANVSFFVSDLASRPPGASGRFDVVVAFAFLHHLADQAIRDTLRAARRSLRDGGIFYSTDPSRRRLVRWFSGFVRTTYDRYHSPGERELDPEGIATLAEAAGLRSITLGYADYALGPLAWLAPGTPRWLAPILEVLDDAALSIPVVNRYASSFRLMARAP